MAIKRFSGNTGTVVTVEFDSKILADNPLGDPTNRQFHVWLPPGYDQSRGHDRGKRYPVLFDLVGYTGSGQSHTNWQGFDENVPERAARLIHSHKMTGCIIVFPDCFTALGGNQYINSSAIGRYADYLTRELIPFIDAEFRTLPDREHRGCFGKSSGGYGALVHGMKYSRYWGAIASHSGDAYFDFIYRSDWPNTLTQLARYRDPKLKPGQWKAPAEPNNTGLDDGRIRAFLEYAWKRERLNHNEMHCLMNLCMAATYDADPEAPNGFRVPFDLDTGEIIPERWRRWLSHDPIKLVRRYGEKLATLSGVYIDCGWRDQYHIHYGNRLISKSLSEQGVKHTYEEFDGTHSGIDKRMNISLPFLVKALRA
ncbi:MAG: alpha/beta hydrolase [Gammaproteobacteria bacterium]